MLRQTIKYSDYNDQEQEETLYFNLTRTEMIDILDLRERLEKWRESTSGPQRDLTSDEIRELVDMVKLLIEKSYGVRSEDGKFFRKSPQIFEDFKQSAVYDAFVFSLFQNPEMAVGFMVGILPKSLADAPELAEARKAVEELALPDIAPDLHSEPQKTLNTTEQEVPAWIREDRDPTPEELQNMSQDELRLAFQRRSERAAAQSQN